MKYSPIAVRVIAGAAFGLGSFSISSAIATEEKSGSSNQYISLGSSTGSHGVSTAWFIDTATKKVYVCTQITNTAPPKCEATIKPFDAL